MLNTQQNILIILFSILSLSLQANEKSNRVKDSDNVIVNKNIFISESGPRCTPMPMCEDWDLYSVDLQIKTTADFRARLHVSNENYLQKNQE